MSRRLFGLLFALMLAVSITAPLAAAPTLQSRLDAIPAYAEAKAKVAAKDYPGAVALLAKVLETHPEEPDALNLMGFSLRHVGRRDEALDFYRRALAHDPQHLSANEYLGELYVQLGQLEKARERLAVLEAACGRDCEETRDLAAAIQASAKP